ncbi:hypothetical protein J2T12_003777 [Paenibacillus anaericanus]|uniref:hypothetical protein n=1 Tax=Paenibacillus anaericanus TaxID=170367 RepID=UPI002786FF6C|nr:hypothetical protein [Paenibacillus anaericanus]MDQ0090354.1 hypothetical protein [Paenibacillus anaericanus]
MTILKRILLFMTFVGILSGCLSFTETVSELSTNIPITSSQGEHVQPLNTVDTSYTGIPLIIYTLSDEVFDLPRTSIPYYRNGEITFLDEVIFTQFEEGHQPWLGTGIDAVTAAASNLTGEEFPFKDSKLSYVQSDERTTTSGIIIKQIKNDFIQLIVPQIGTYEIELRSPADTSILFISKITLIAE